MPQDIITMSSQVALKVGLPMPVPDRWDKVPDELLEEYILGFEQVLLDPDLRDGFKASMASAIWEHVRVRHKKYFDVVADYYQRAEKITASQLFFTLKKMCGSNLEMADRMLEVYNTDPRWYKHYFFTYFAEKGTQKHWDAIAKDATTAEDVQHLEILATSKKRQLDKHGVNPWIPELPASDPE